MQLLLVLRRGLLQGSEFLLKSPAALATTHLGKSWSRQQRNDQ
jgi:hypothetical protein